MKKILYKKLLVTHDGSRFASATLPHVASLARMYDAEILFLQVVPSVEQEIFTMTPASIGTGVYPIITDIARDNVMQFKREAKQNLAKLKEDLSLQGVKKIQVLLKEGSPEEVINEVAKTKHCDLIVISTHGLSGVKRAFLGSVTDYVIRHTHCPVLVVHPEKGGE